YAATCSVTLPVSAHDVVAAITIPAGPSKDLDVRATAASNEVSVAIFSTCGSAGTELSCGASPGASSIRTRARGLSPGTYFAVVTTQIETSVELRVDLLDATPK